MKKIISAVFSIMILCAFAAHAIAQKGEWKLNLNYNYSLPLGSFKNDIINNASPRGFSGDFMYGINNKFDIGVYGGYQDYYQKYPRAIYQTDNHEVTSAVLSNSIQTMPILLKASFSPLGETHAPLKPYIAVGAGYSIINFTQYLGEFGGTTTNGGFTAQGSAGVKIPFGKYSNSGVNIGADYNYISYNKYGYNNLNNVSLHAGVYFPLR
jgi:hypothetical protein